MNSTRIVVLIRAGLPYKKTILYGHERAKEMGAKLRLIGVIPNLDESRRFALSMFEFCSYEALSKKQEQEAAEYLERAIQFCLDRAIAVESGIAAGGLDGVMKDASKEIGTKLVVVPTPVREESHHEFLSALKHFAHDLYECEPRCPIVSVLAT